MLVSVVADALKFLQTVFILVNVILALSCPPAVQGHFLIPFVKDVGEAAEAWALGRPKSVLPTSITNHQGQSMAQTKTTLTSSKASGSNNPTNAHTVPTTTNSAGPDHTSDTTTSKPPLATAITNLTSLPTPTSIAPTAQSSPSMTALSSISAFPSGPTSPSMTAFSNTAVRSNAQSSHTPSRVTSSTEGTPSSAPAVPSPTSGHSSSHIGAIIGGVLGGLLFVFLLAGVYIYVSRRRHRGSWMETASVHTAHYSTDSVEWNARLDNTMHQNELERSRVQVDGSEDDMDFRCAESVSTLSAEYPEAETETQAQRRRAEILSQIRAALVSVRT